MGERLYTGSTGAILLRFTRVFPDRKTTIIGGNAGTVNACLSRYLPLPPAEADFVSEA
jgi:hypothetical protein